MALKVFLFFTTLPFSVGEEAITKETNKPTIKIFELFFNTGVSHGSNLIISFRLLLLIYD